MSAIIEKEEIVGISPDRVIHIPGFISIVSGEGEISFLLVKGTETAILISDGGDPFQKSGVSLRVGDSNFQIWDDRDSLIGYRIITLARVLARYDIKAVLYVSPMTNLIGEATCFDLQKILESKYLPEEMILVKNSLVIEKSEE